MVSIYNNTDDLINSMIKINSELIKINVNKSKKLPISCKYYLTIFDLIDDIEINKFFSYITDETRTIEYPFIRDNNIDYSMMLEIDQFYNVDLCCDETIKNISNNIDYFIDVVNQSNGKIIFILDICFLLNFMIKMKNISKANHIIDLIIYKLSNLSKMTNSNIINVSEILILDRQNIIKNPENLFYIQLKYSLMKNITTQNERYIHVYKDTDETIVKNVYWNVLDPCIKISEYISQIKSPFDDNSYFSLVKINDKQYFVKKINVNDCIDKNLFDLDNNPGIIIDPIDRLYI